MKLVDALSSSARKGSCVCVGENSGDCQLLGPRVASADYRAGPKGMMSFERNKKWFDFLAS